jgi:histidine ammonia-lyase
MTDNAAHIVAIELLAAAQGVELRRPLKSSAPLEAALARVREHAAFLSDDRPLAAEISAIAGKVLDGAFAESRN